MIRTTNSRMTRASDDKEQSAPAPGVVPNPCILQSASREQLLSLVARLAGDSGEIAARIRYLTEPAEAGKALLARIRSIRNGRRYVDYGKIGAVASSIESIMADVRADVLPNKPLTALTLAEKLFSLDEMIFNRADDSGGAIGGALRDGCILWLDAAAAVRRGGAKTDWVSTLYGLYRKNEYGIREPLLEEAHRLLDEQEMRTLAAQFERDAIALMEHSPNKVSHHVFAPTAAMGLVARALQDPILYERSTRIHSFEPNEIQSMDIASHYLEYNDARAALRWLERPFRESVELQRLQLLDQAYAQLNDRPSQTNIRRELYRRAPSIHTYRSLEELLSPEERAALRARACKDAHLNPSLASAAELLFGLDEPHLAEQLIVARAGDLDGSNYPLLIPLADVARTRGRLVGASLIYRALIDAILARGYAKAYGHGARYLQKLREIASQLEDFFGHVPHAEYENALRTAHRRKTSFWSRLSESRWRLRPDP